MVQLYFSSARCNPSDRLNRHGRGGCSYVQRQKPGNDFDKVTERRPTTRRIKKELPIVSVCHARARKFISATFGHAVDVVFSLRSKADECVPAPCATWGCKEQRSGAVWQPVLSFRVFTRSTHCARTLAAPFYSHNSSSGDPHPTNFQIINISVAALLRAS